MARELQEFEGYKGVWRTVGGRHIFIRDGEDLPSAMKRSGKFNNSNNSQKSYNIISGDENDIRMKERDTKEREYYETMMKREDELNKLDAEGKISNEDYEKEWLKNRNEYDDKMNSLRQKKIYDSKKDEVLYLKNSQKVIDENKQFKGAKPSNLTSEEESAITLYTGGYTYGSSGHINTYLNDKEVYLNSDTKEKMLYNINLLDNAMKKNKIGGNYQFYRGIEPSRLENEEIANAITKLNKGAKSGHMVAVRKQAEILDKIKGTDIETKGFMSTSKYLDSNYTKRGVTLVINSNEDDRAIDISSLSKYNGKRDTRYLSFYTGNVQTENEVLFDRNTTLTVRDYAITEDGVFLFCDTKQKRKK